MFLLPSIFPRSSSNPALSGLDTCLQVQDTWTQKKVVARKVVTCSRSQRKPEPTQARHIPGSPSGPAAVWPPASWPQLPSLSEHPSFLGKGRGKGVGRQPRGPAPEWDGPGRKPLPTAPRFLGNCHCTSSQFLIALHRGNSNCAVTTALCTSQKPFYLLTPGRLTGTGSGDNQLLESPIPRRIN